MSLRNMGPVLRAICEIWYFCQCPFDLTLLKFKLKWVDQQIAVYRKQKQMTLRLGQRQWWPCGENRYIEVENSRRDDGWENRFIEVATDCHRQLLSSSILIICQKEENNARRKTPVSKRQVFLAPLHFLALTDALYVANLMITDLGGRPTFGFSHTFDWITVLLHYHDHQFSVNMKIIWFVFSLGYFWWLVCQVWVGWWWVSETTAGH